MAPTTLPLRNMHAPNHSREIGDTLVIRPQVIENTRLRFSSGTYYCIEGLGVTALPVQLNPKIGARPNFVPFVFQYLRANCERGTYYLCASGASGYNLGSAWRCSK